MNNPQVEYTDTQLLELRHCFNDPLYFINNYCYVEDPNGGKKLINVNDHQEYIPSILSDQENISHPLINGANTGSSVFLAAYIYWFALSKPYKNCVVVSEDIPKNKQVRDIVKFMYDNTEPLLKPGLKRCQQDILQFDNDSKILFTRPSSLRGYRIDLLIFNGISYTYSNTIRQNGVLSTLNASGRSIATITPQ